MWTETVGKDRNIFLFNRLWFLDSGTGTVQQAKKSTSQDAWWRPPVQAASGKFVALAITERGPLVCRCDLDPIWISSDA